MIIGSAHLRPDLAGERAEPVIFGGTLITLITPITLILVGLLDAFGLREDDHRPEAGRVTVELDRRRQRPSGPTCRGPAGSARPRGPVKRPRALLLDERQEVPEVLGAVKRLVDRGVPAGSFLLTGSVRASLDSAIWPGTGRVIHLDMHPMTVLESSTKGSPLPDRGSLGHAG